MGTMGLVRGHRVPGAEKEVKRGVNGQWAGQVEVKERT